MKQKHVQRIHVIVGGLFEMTAVVVHLEMYLFGNHFAAELLPPGCVREVCVEKAEGVERYRLAQQVRVRRKEKRKVVLQMTAVPMELVQETAAQSGRHAAAGQLINPHPGECSKADLERTRPVDAAMKRIRGDPAFDLGPDLVQEAIVAREQKSLREQHQVLMAVQLPNDLMVSGLRRVQIRNAAEIVQTCFPAADIVAPPVDLWPSFDGQAQQREPVFENLLSEADHPGCEFGVFEALRDAPGIDCPAMRRGGEGKW